MPYRRCTVNSLLSPSYWVGVFSALAIAGIVLVVIGSAAKLPLPAKIGLLLGAPIVIGGVLLVLLIFPILIIANWKHAQADKKNNDEAGG